MGHGVQTSSSPHEVVTPYVLCSWVFFDSASHAIAKGIDTNHGSLPFLIQFEVGLQGDPILIDLEIGCLVGYN